MKKQTLLPYLMMASLASVNYDLTGRGEVGTSKEAKPVKPNPMPLVKRGYDDMVDSDDISAKGQVCEKHTISVEYKGIYLLSFEKVICFGNRKVFNKKVQKFQAQINNYLAFRGHDGVVADSDSGLFSRKDL